MNKSTAKKYLKRIKNALKKSNPVKSLQRMNEILDDAKCRYCGELKRGGNQQGSELCESHYRDGV